MKRKWLTVILFLFCIEFVCSSQDEKDKEDKEDNSITSTENTHQAFFSVSTTDSKPSTVTTKTDRNVCLNFLNATEEVQFTTSPGFPNVYPPDIQCTTIITAEPNQQIILEILSCQIEKFIDLLFITIGSETIPIMNSCPPYFPYQVPVKSNIVNVTLITDEWRNYQGFQISYKATESFTCDDQEGNSKDLDVTFLIPLQYVNNNMKNGIKLIMNNLWDEDKVRFNVVIWDYYSAKRILLDIFSQFSTKILMFNYIDGIQPGGSWFHMNFALKTVQKEVVPFTRGGEVPHSVVIFDYGYYSSISPIADQLKDAGVNLQFVIQNPSNRRFYELMASRLDYVISSNNFVIVKDSWNISNRVCYPDVIKQKSCNISKSVDLTFVVQDSSSFSVNFFNDFVKTSIKTIIKSFHDDASRYNVRTALLTFGSTSRIFFNLNDPTYSTAIEQTFFRIDYNLMPRREVGNDLATALDTVRTDIVPKTRQMGIPHIVVVLTDGQTTTNATEEANLLKETGAFVFGIGVGSSSEISTLNEISTNPNEYVTIINDLSELWNFSKTISTAACNPVKIDAVNFACNQKEVDITMIITDGGYSPSEFNIFVKSTVKTIVNDLWDESGSYSVRFSLVLHCGGNIIFNLNDTFGSKVEVFQLIDKIQYRFGEYYYNFNNYCQDLNSALYSTYSQVVPKCRNGNVPHVVLIIDPGYSYNSDYYSDVLKGRGSFIVGLSQRMHIGVKSFLEIIATDIESVFMSNTIQGTFGLTTNITKHFCRLFELYSSKFNSKPKSCDGFRTVDVTFLVQDSDVFSDSYFKQFVISTIKTIIRGFHFDSSRYNARISLISYGTTTQIVIPFETGNSMEIQQTFVALNYWSSRKQNGNDLALGLRNVTQSLIPKTRKVDVPYIVIVMTDGQNSTSVADEIDLMKKENVHAVFAIGIGSTVKRTTLEIIASSAEYVFVGDIVPNLVSFTPNITRVVCQTINKTNKNTNCLKNFDGLDITFILANYYYFTSSQSNVVVKSFLKTIVNNLWTDESENKSVRFSLVTSDVAFNLDKKYENKTMIFNEINSMSFGYDLTSALIITRNRVVPLTRKGKIPHVVLIFDYGYYTSDRTEADRLKKEGSIIYVVNVISHQYYRFYYDLVASFEQYANVPLNWLDVVEMSYQVSLTVCDPFLFNRTKSCNKVRPVDVTFAVQTSSTVSYDNFTGFVVPNIINIIKALDEDSSRFSFRTSLLTFGSTPTIVRNIDWIYNYGGYWASTAYPQTPDVERIISAMEFNTNFPGFTGNDLSTVLMAIRTNILPKVRPVNVPHLVIVFTDGQSTTNVTEQANLLKKTNSTLFMIGVGNNINRSILTTVASKADFVLVPSTWQDIVTFSPKITGAVCQPKYIAKPWACETDRGIDITIVLSDNSFTAMDINIYFKSFIKDLINNMWDESKNQRVRFSLIMNNATPTIVFNLNSSFTNKSIILDIVDDLQYDYGYTDLSVAFGLIRKNILPLLAKRENVPHFLLFISYGNSDIGLASDIAFIKQAGSTIFMMQMISSNNYFYEVVASDIKNVLNFQSPADLLSQSKNILDYMCNAKVNKKIKSCDAVDKSLELTFVFEESYSTLGNIIIPTIKSLIKYFYDDASIQNVRFGLISYSDTSYVHFKQNTYSSDIVSIFRYIANNVYNRGGYGNNLQYALNAVITEIVPDLQVNVPHIVIVMTSGNAWYGIEDYSVLLKKTQASVFVLAVGNSINYNNIRMIASGEKYIKNVTNVNDTMAFASTIGNAVCSTPKSYVDYSNRECLKKVKAISTVKYYESPNFPDDYPINCFCRLNIDVSTDEVILISITDCGLEKGSDYLTIYSGSEIDTNNLVENISSCPTLPYKIYILASSSVITFKTDATITNKGFKLGYSSVPAYNFNGTTSPKPTMTTTKGLECPSKYCKNGGTCQSKTCPNNDRYCCQCRQDYSGDRCEYARQGVIGMAMRSTKAYQKELEDTSSTYYAYMVISFVSYIMVVLMQTFVRYSGFYSFFFYVTIIGFSQGSTIANSTTNVAYASTGTNAPSVSMPTTADIKTAMVQNCNGNNNACKDLGIDTNYIYVSVNPDLCLSNKTNMCSNNAKCIFKSGVTYSCKCMDGYRDDSDLDSGNVDQRLGIRCTEECTDQCNGGTCDERYDNKVVCNCTFTRQGARCENLSGIGIALVIVFGVIIPILIIIVIVIVVYNCKKHSKYNSKVDIRKFYPEDDFNVFEDPAHNKQTFKEPKIVLVNHRI